MNARLFKAAITISGAFALFLPTIVAAQSREAYGLVTSIQFLENGSIGIQKMQVLRNGSVRIGLDWAIVQSQPNGPFDFSFTDAMLDSARNTGMEIYANLGNPPAWAAPCPECRPYDVPSQWYAYARAVIDRYYGRYGSAITFGIWNEPNDKKFLRDNPSDDHGESDPLLYFYIAWHALRARNDLGNGARIAFGDITPTAWNDGWFQSFWGNIRGTVQSQDLIAVHWYPSDGDIYNLMSGLISYTGREVWMTETGTLTPTSDSAQVDAINYLISTFQYRPGYVANWTRFFYYRLWDGQCCAEALLRPDWSNRPGFDTYKNRIPGGSSATILSAGQGLNPGQSVASPNGRFMLSYQTDANLVLYDNGSPVWAINCWPQCSDIGAPGVAVMQGDGNFVVYNSGGGPVWWSGTDGNPGAYLAIQDDGNLVVYSSGGTVLWQR